MADLWAYKAFHVLYNLGTEKDILMSTNTALLYISLSDSVFTAMRSVHYDNRWMFGVTKSAECMCPLDPAAHTCGIYTHNSRDGALEYSLENTFWHGSDDYGNVSCVCLVRLYGRIRVGEYGYISEAASLEKVLDVRPLALYPAINMALNWLEKQSLPFASLKEAGYLVSQSQQSIQEYKDHESFNRIPFGRPIPYSG